jgi:hypothetical protein
LRKLVEIANAYASKVTTMVASAISGPEVVDTCPE